MCEGPRLPAPRPASRLFKLAGIALAILVLAGAALTWHLRRGGTEGWASYRPLSQRQSQLDRAATAAFLDPGRTRQDRYDVLFRYFLRGAVEHASRDGAAVQYPGLPSMRGYRVSGLEGFARTAPLLAAWLASGRPRQVRPLGSAAPVDLPRWIARGLAAGTDPASAGYWGTFGPDDQRIVEAADIARTVWLARGSAWQELTRDQQAHVIAWLRAALTAPVRNRNNWQLFQPVIGSVLHRLGQGGPPDLSGYRAFAGNRLQAGWFRDGPDGHVDYYNTWGIAYDLFWIGLLNPQLLPGGLRRTLADNAALTRHLISPRGIPILGRSQCYRTAVPTSVLAAGHLAGTGVSAQQGAGALDATWTYFIGHRILRDGTITMGYLQTEPALVEYYSGAGSCHWGLRSLTLAYLHPPQTPFWTARPEPLPVQQGDYRLDLPRLGWSVRGTRATGEIAIRQTAVPANAPRPALAPYGPGRRLAAELFHRPFRPQNEAAKYRAPIYRATAPQAVADDRH